MFTRCSTESLPTYLTHPLPEEIPVPQITVFELEEALATEPENLVLIDIRRHCEYETIRFSGAELIPFTHFLHGNGVAEVKAILSDRRCSVMRSPAPKLIVYCTMGVSSDEAVELLRQSGISALSLKGGMRAWQYRIQPFHHHYIEIAHTMAPKIVNAIAPRKKALCISALAILAVGFMGWETRELMHNPDPLRPLLAAGVPLQLLENVPYLGRAVRAAELPQITVSTLKQKMDRHDGDFVLLDVRSPEEYQAARIPGAVSVPMTEIQSGKGIEQVKTLLHGRQLLVYCTSGYRSAKALMRLQEAGLSGIQIKGGIQEWDRAIGS
jgi:rhodanese-related sulfurtransferase